MLRVSLAEWIYLCKVNAAAGFFFPPCRRSGEYVNDQEGTAVTRGRRMFASIISAVMSVAARNDREMGIKIAGGKMNKQCGGVIIAAEKSRPGHL